jgi:hypothetical protein
MSYDKPRITDITMSTLDIVMALSEGNPGAVRVLMELYDAEKTMDPDSAWGGFGPGFGLDNLDIYGSKIWILYKDVCSQNIEATLAVLRAHQLGILSEGRIKSAIDGLLVIDVPGTILKVKEELPAFGRK